MRLHALIALLPLLVALSAEAAPVRVMFERDDDVADNELIFRSYASFDDMANNLPSGPDRVSPINIASVFSTTGLTWDGQQFVVMFERDDDVADNELIFRTYASFDDMADNLPSGPDRVSPINISGVFSTRGLSWDGQQYVVMFERDDDVADNELIFRTYADFDDLVDNLPSGPDRVSPINISGVFSTTGLAFEWTADPPPPQPVPSPGGLPLAALALLAAAASMRLSRARA